VNKSGRSEPACEEQDAEESPKPFKSGVKETLGLSASIDNDED
jgi:hypothetical protein